MLSSFIVYIWSVSSNSYDQRILIKLWVKERCAWMKGKSTFRFLRAKKNSAKIEDHSRELRNFAMKKYSNSNFLFCLDNFLAVDAL